MSDYTRVIPLGGLGEVGMNCMLLENETEIIMVDCGVLFSHSPWLGYNVLVPDFSYIKKSNKKFLGLVITHGHEDHIGGIPQLLSEIAVPYIYATSFTRALVESKIKDYGNSMDFRGEMITTESGKTYSLGQFKFEYISITHSIVESFSLYLQTPGGSIFHTGDFKLDENPYKTAKTDYTRLKQIGDSQPLLMMADSTNSEQSGFSKDDQFLLPKLKAAMNSAQQLLVVGCFASNITRVQMVLDLAREMDRKVILNGKSMQKYIQLALERGLIQFPSDVLVTPDQFSQYPREKLVVLCSGTQGEFMSSLVRLAMEEDRFIKLEPNDTVIFSSLKIPGNEININFLLNQLSKRGADVIHEREHGVHVTGHAYQGEQRKIIEIIQPQNFLAVHGEHRMLRKHAQTASEVKGVKNSFVIENGQCLELRDGTVCKIDIENVASKKWVSGNFSGDVNSLEIREKKRAAREGTVSLALLIQGRHLMATPSVVLSGLLCDERAREVISINLQKELKILMVQFAMDSSLTEDFLKEKIHAIARRICNREISSKPVILIHMI